MATQSSSLDILSSLIARQLPSGGWPYRPGIQQASLEPTCLALLALQPSRPPAWHDGITFLMRTQNPDGSWPAFEGDDQGSWTTALAVLALSDVPPCAKAYERGLRWLLRTKGKESHWFWKWKFLTADRHVRFDPNKFGWPWTVDTNSWVVPTAYSLLALQQNSSLVTQPLARSRIDRGMQMLFDRVCPEGGWNSGNGVVYGVPLAAHLDATAIALLPLSGETSHALVQRAVSWLETTSLQYRSPWSSAWTAMALTACRRPAVELLARATTGFDCEKEDVAVVAAVALACDSINGRNIWGIAG